jgi:agmatine deiminase
MSSLRLPAEWEPQSFIQYTFPHPYGDWGYLYERVQSCFVEIIQQTAQFVPVLVVCHDEVLVRSFFTEKTQYPIFFVTVPSDDTWARDHGSITVLKGDQPVLLDFIFNGWGNKFSAANDTDITSRLHAAGVFGGITCQSLLFVLEGGALESDGMGTLLTTSECLLSPERNPQYSREEIEKYLKAHLGLSRILWLDHGYLAGDDTDSHIDTLARFCTPEVIAYVKCDDPTDEHYTALAAMKQQLKSFRQVDGKPYQLVPLPWPDACFDEDGNRLPATYANFLFVNNAVLVPTYGVAQDEAALKVFESIFPKLKVVGLDCRVLIEQHGSLHCISMQYPKGVSLNLK